MGNFVAKILDDDAIQHNLRHSSSGKISDRELILVSFPMFSDTADSMAWLLSLPSVAFHLEMEKLWKRSTSGIMVHQRHKCAKFQSLPSHFWQIMLRNVCISVLRHLPVIRDRHGAVENVASPGKITPFVLSHD